MGDRFKVGPGVVIYRTWKTWWVDARGGGTRIRRSLRTRDRAEAIQKALDIFNRKASTPHKLETLQHSLDRYMIQHSALHHRPATGKRYRAVIQGFIDGVGPAIPPARVERRHVIEFQNLRSHAVRPDTVNGDVGYVKAFLRWCMAEGLIDRDPGFKVKRVKTNRSKRRTPTPEEFAGVSKAAAANEFLQEYVAVAAETGMRPNEILHVRGCDLTGKMLSITAWGSWRTKDAEDRTIELNPAALAILAHRKLVNGNDSLPLFAGRLGVVRDWKNLYHELKRSLPPQLSWVGLYSFRHYFGTECVKHGWPAEKLRLYMGHADIATTLKYYVDVRAEQVGAPPILCKRAAN